jgi:hypothetical protein
MSDREPRGGAIPVLIATFFLFVPVALLFSIPRERPISVAEDYQRAVHEAMQPKSSYVSHSLVSVNPDQPVKVVTWTQRQRVSDYEGKTTAPKETWVTVAPRLKSFCQDYVKSHGADPEKLTLRLQQRLGLPPESHSDRMFVELTVEDPKSILRFFRPCADPSPNSNTCQPPDLPKPREIWKHDFNALTPDDSREMGKVWLLANYYASFASPSQYPWTALGYTFDWGPQEGGRADFVRWGESEFVVPAGAPIRFVSATETVAYCTPE